jgi:hypothetical protein
MTFKFILEADIIIALLLRQEQNVGRTIKKI